MKTAVFFLSVTVAALAGCLVVVWNRPVPPPTLDGSEALTLADLDLTAKAAASNVRMAGVTVDALADSGDGTATVQVTVRMADGTLLRAEGVLEHGWHVVAWREPGSVTPATRAP